MARLAAVSVDLDEIPNYFRIHSLPEEPRVAHHVYDVALARLGAFARDLDIPLTLFAIGSDLDRPESVEHLRALVDAGHVVENHSQNHLYDLTRKDRATIAHEIVEGADAIERATGRRPRGFRAPGYTVNDALFDTLEEAGVAFDSSVFPCPAYYSAKAVALALIRARGGASASILDTPRVMIAPRAPYRPGARWFERGARRFIELPIQTTRGLRLPFIGTSVALAGAYGAGLLARQCLGDELVNLELHGIDFLDREDGLDDLARVQRELRVPLRDRLIALRAAIDTLRAHGYTFVTLDETAMRIVEKP